MECDTLGSGRAQEYHMLYSYKMGQYHVQLDLLCTLGIDHSQCAVYNIIIVGVQCIMLS